MARNKHPEVTVNKILEASMKLFLKNGYEKTTIQDIVNELGGLTKGAVYHHFKSKEDIMNELNEYIFHKNDPFRKVINEPGLNALQKIRKVFRSSAENTLLQNINIQAISLLKNPRCLSELIQSNQKFLAPLFCGLIQEGIKDGSIKTIYPKQVSEIVVILINFWMVPTIFPVTQKEMQEKLCFVRDITDMMGVHIFDEETFAALTLSCNNICKYDFK